MTSTNNDRRDIIYVCNFDAVELDLIYELARDARNNLPDPEGQVEKGSWADAIIQLDKKMTEIFHRRMQ